MKLPKLAILALSLALLGWTAAAARAGSPESPSGGATAAPETKGAGHDDAPVVDEMPVPVRTVAPAYPESARRRKAEGTVLGQDPAAGTDIDKGDSVRLTIAAGRDTVAVPDLRFRTEGEAIQLLRGELVVGRRRDPHRHTEHRRTDRQ